MLLTAADFFPGNFAGEMMDLFRSQDNTPYATVLGKTYNIQGSEFKDFINIGYFNENGDFPLKQQLRAIVEKCENFARLKGDVKPVFRRVARTDDAVYLDLGTPEFDVIEITADSVRQIINPPVKFIRSKIQRSIGGINPDALAKDLELLTKYVPFKTDGDFILFVAWLMSCLNTHGGYPPLFLVGEQGSAKSTTSAFIKSLLDDSMVPLRNLSKTMKEMMIAGSNDFVLCYDNISKITDTQSDNLCKMATGAGFTTRKLYTTVEEVQLQCKNPVVINSIAVLPMRQDLTDRSVIVHLTFIPPEARKTSKEIWEAWEQDRPAILGALCNAVSASLRNFDQVEEDNLPRMADFAKWVIAGEEQLPWEQGTFLVTMRNLRTTMVEEAIEADTTALAVLELMKGRQDWNGSASDLLTRLEESIDLGKRRYPDFPKIPNQLSRNLNLISAFLREKGIHFEKAHSGSRSITLTNTGFEKAAESESPAVHPQKIMEMASQKGLGVVQNTFGAARKSADIALEDFQEAAEPAMPQMASADNITDF